MFYLIFHNFIIIIQIIIQELHPIRFYFKLINLIIQIINFLIF
jgi:hypothetical protein